MAYRGEMLRSQNPFHHRSLKITVPNCFLLFRFEKILPSKAELEKEYAFMKQHLSELESPSVFCHNDLLLANVVYNAQRNTVTFIDYEYAAYNYQSYDIANHFNEYAGILSILSILFYQRIYAARSIPN